MGLLPDFLLYFRRNLSVLKKISFLFAFIAYHACFAQMNNRQTHTYYLQIDSLGHTLDTTGSVDYVFKNKLLSNLQSLTMVNGKVAIRILDTSFYAGGKISERHNWFYGYTTNLVDISRIVYSIGSHDSSFTTYLDSGVWVESGKSSYYFDQYRHDTALIVQSVRNRVEKPFFSYLYHYVYNSAHKPLSITTIYYNHDILSSTSKDSFVYDSKGYLTSSYTCSNVTKGFYDTRVTYTINSSGHTSHWLREQRAGGSAAFVPVSEFDSVFNANGLLEKIVANIWDTASRVWETGSVNKYKYNTLRDLVRMEAHYYQQGKWTQATAAIYTYDTTLSSLIDINKKAEGLTLFPNPANTILNIRAEDVAGQMRMVIRDINGRNVWDKTYTPASEVFQTTIPLYFLPKGLYTVQMISSEGTRTEKFIRQ
jgi:hypothetical protein